MTKDEHSKLQQLRYLLRKSGYFAFEKGGKFFLYREGGTTGRNHLVLMRTDIDRFVRDVKTAAQVSA